MAAINMSAGSDDQSCSTTAEHNPRCVFCAERRRPAKEGEEAQNKTAQLQRIIHHDCISSGLAAKGQNVPHLRSFEAFKGTVRARHVATTQTSFQNEPMSVEWGVERRRVDGGQQGRGPSCQTQGDLSLA